MGRTKMPHRPVSPSARKRLYPLWMGPLCLGLAWAAVRLPAEAATATAMVGATVVEPVSVQVTLGVVPATLSTSGGWVAVLLPPSSPPPPPPSSSTATSGGEGGGSVTAASTGTGGSEGSGASTPLGAGDGTLGSGLAASTSLAPPAGTTGSYNVTVAFN